MYRYTIEAELIHSTKGLIKLQFTVLGGDENDAFFNADAHTTEIYGARFLRGAEFKVIKTEMAGDLFNPFVGNEVRKLDIITNRINKLI